VTVALWAFLVLVIVLMISTAIGLGRCHTCDRLCAPWATYCREHDPYGGAR
jgi:hypothetical protein